MGCFQKDPKFKKGMPRCFIVKIIKPLYSKAEEIMGQSNMTEQKAEQNPFESPSNINDENEDAADVNILRNMLNKNGKHKSMVMPPKQ